MTKRKTSKPDFFENLLFEHLDTKKKKVVASIIIGIIGFLLIGTQIQVSSDATVHVFIVSTYPTFSVYLAKADATGTLQESTLETLQVVQYQGLWQGASSNKYSSGLWTFIKIVINDTALYGVFAVPKHMLLFFPSYCEVSVTVLNNGVKINSVALK
jgi:hypothetical protein